MAVVLAATRVFVYDRMAADFGQAIDRELGARLAGVVAIVVDDGDDLGNPREDPLVAVDDAAFVQVLQRDGSVAGTTDRALESRPVLPPIPLGALRDDSRTVDMFVPALEE